MNLISGDVVVSENRTSDFFVLNVHELMDTFMIYTIGQFQYHQTPGVGFGTPPQQAS